MCITNNITTATSNNIVMQDTFNVELTPPLPSSPVVVVVAVAPTVASPVEAVPVVVVAPTIMSPVASIIISGSNGTYNNVTSSYSSYYQWW